MFSGMFSGRSMCRLALLALLCLALVATAHAGAPPSLKTVPVPPVDGLDSFVRDRDAAVVLGKALFWDQQVGGDGVMSCAVCHWHAGADARTYNNLNPGANGAFEMAGANSEMKMEDFPFHKLANVEDRNSAVISDMADIAGSQGVVKTSFTAVDSDGEARFVPRSGGGSADGGGPDWRAQNQ